MRLCYIVNLRYESNVTLRYALVARLLGFNGGGSGSVAE